MFVNELYLNWNKWTETWVWLAHLFSQLIIIIITEFKNDDINYNSKIIIIVRGDEEHRKCSLTVEKNC